MELSALNAPAPAKAHHRGAPEDAMVSAVNQLESLFRRADADLTYTNAKLETHFGARVICPPPRQDPGPLPHPRPRARSLAPRSGCRTWIRSS